MTDSDAVWPVLIVNGRLLIIPAFLTNQPARTAAIEGILRQEINPGYPPVRKTVLARTFSIEGIGNLTGYFRFNPIPGELVDRPPALVRDEASTVQYMIEGVLTQATPTNEIESQFLDTLRPNICTALKVYLNDPTSWPAPEQSRPVPISDIIAAQTDQDYSKLRPIVRAAVPDDTPDAHSVLAVEPIPVRPHLPQQQQIRPSIWPPSYIVVILFFAGAITGIILWQLLSRLFG